MRIIAGEFKGRQLSGPRSGVTRPTADRVREALFSIIGDISSLHVLDLFAGTGAVGIEALSRGADHATFIERDGRTHAALRKNLAIVLGPGPWERAEVVKGNGITFLEKTVGTFDLVILDPPYAEADKLAPKLASALPPVLNADAIVVAECHHRFPLKLESFPQGGCQVALELSSERKYGDTLLRVFRGVSGGA